MKDNENADNPEDGVGYEFTKAANDVLPILRYIYKRMFIKQDINKIINEKTLWLMVSASDGGRRELAQKLAFTPIVRESLALLKDKYDAIYDLLKYA